VTITAKDVAEIMKLLEASAFDELKLETGDLKLHLRRSGAPVRDAAPAPPIPPRAPAAPQPPVPPIAPKVPAPPADPSLTEVPSPLLGIYYRAPKPGADPFIEVGQTVEPDTIIGIVEVMKLMNSVRAGVKGEVVEIVARNAEMVEYGETLIRVRTA
jgi:acetyl-CoA carboxylase biotin carboxyl carrier protein